MMKLNNVGPKNITEKVPYKNGTENESQNSTKMKIFKTTHGKKPQ